MAGLTPASESVKIHAASNPQSHRIGVLLVLAGVGKFMAARAKRLPFNVKKLCVK